MRISWIKAFWPFRNAPLGQKSEDLAARLLKSEGAKILARNYQNRYGEIDLIALEGGQIVFVEVRSRSSTRSGHPVETVNQSKQRKICRAAQAFLRTVPDQQVSPRFDVITVIWSDDERQSELKRYRDAFSLVE